MIIATMEDLGFYESVESTLLKRFYYHKDVIIIIVMADFELFLLKRPTSDSSTVLFVPCLLGSSHANFSFYSFTIPA